MKGPPPDPREQILQLRWTSILLVCVGLAGQLAFYWYFQFRMENVFDMLGRNKPLPWLLEWSLIYFHSPLFWIFGLGSSLVAIFLLGRCHAIQVATLTACLSLLISFGTILPASVALELTHAAVLQQIIQGAKEKGLIK